MSELMATYLRGFRRWIVSFLGLRLYITLYFYGVCNIDSLLYVSTHREMRETGTKPLAT